MTFLQSISSVLGNYATFRGRAPRSEYWWYQLFLILLYFVVGFLVGLTSSNENGAGIGGLIMLLTFLIFFLPSLAVVIRRLHDINRTGWWTLITFIPFGSLVLLYFSLCRGTDGSNDYGPDPL